MTFEEIHAQVRATIRRMRPPFRWKSHPSSHGDCPSGQLYYRRWRDGDIQYRCDACGEMWWGE